MFYVISTIAALCFISHVSLLVASFGKHRFHSNRYFYSHLTLWITGLLLFILALLYSSKGISGFIDYFDTTVKKLMILVVTAGLSLVAHTIVKRLIMPRNTSLVKKK